MISLPFQYQNHINTKVQNISMTAHQRIEIGISIFVTFSATLPLSKKYWFTTFMTFNSKIPKTVMVYLKRNCFPEKYDVDIKDYIFNLCHQELSNALCSNPLTLAAAKRRLTRLVKLFKGKHSLANILENCLLDHYQLHSLKHSANPK